MRLGPLLVNLDNNIAEKQINHITFFSLLILSELQDPAAALTRDSVLALM